MKIIVTGAQGMLGTDVTKRLLQKGFDVFAFGKKELDVENFQEVDEMARLIKPDAVIHAAAFTKVDLAEREEEKAFSVNGIGTRNVAVASEKIGAKLMLISTDYVFDGTLSRPYREFDCPNPLNVYGQSKLLAERFVQQFHTKWFIIRTSWLFGKHGRCFVGTMLDLAKERKDIHVVKDQIGSPTYTGDLSEKMIELCQTEKYGIYHITNTGACSWFELAKAVFTEAGINEINIIPCTTDQMKRAAQRPHYSVLDNLALRLNGFACMRSWEDALKAYLKET